MPQELFNGIHGEAQKRSGIGMAISLGENNAPRLTLQSCSLNLLALIYYDYDLRRNQLTLSVYLYRFCSLRMIL